MRGWILTSGTDSGISKLMGEAKDTLKSSVPLIGMVGWGLVEGRQALWDVPGVYVHMYVCMYVCVCVIVEGP